MAASAKGSVVVVTTSHVMMTDGFSGVATMSAAKGTAEQSLSAASKEGSTARTSCTATPTSRTLRPPARRVYLGGYNGLFRSCDDGRSWTKMDVQIPLVTGVHIGRSGRDGLGVAACTYLAAAIKVRWTSAHSSAGVRAR